MKTWQRRTFIRDKLMPFGILMAIPGCQPSTELSTFFQDFAREVLAAFLL